MHSKHNELTSVVANYRLGIVEKISHCVARQVSHLDEAEVRIKVYEDTLKELKLDKGEIDNIIRGVKLKLPDEFDNIKSFMFRNNSHGGSEINPEIVLETDVICLIGFLELKEAYEKEQTIKEPIRVL
jgi:hypothetical protein